MLISHLKVSAIFSTRWALQSNATLLSSQTTRTCSLQSEKWPSLCLLNLEFWHTFQSCQHVLFLILHLLFAFDESNLNILTCHWWGDFYTCFILYNCDHASLCTPLYSSLYSATSGVFIYSLPPSLYKALNMLLSSFLITLLRLHLELYRYWS